MSKRTALVAGATGLVGSHCLERLLASDVYDRVVAITRRALDRTHDKLVTCQVDFAHLRDHRDELAGDDVFLCLGTTLKKAGSPERFRDVDYGYSLAVAQAAQLGGAKQVLLVSSVGASTRSGALYLRVKGELEAAISVLPYRAHHVFRPSMLLGQRSESRGAEAVVAAVSRVFSPAMVGGLRRYRPVRAEVLARAMVAVAEAARPGPHLYEGPDIPRMAG